MYTYATYSPSFRPTISSVTWISTYVLPLCTAKRRPTKFGRMVAARFVVRMGGVLGGGGKVRGSGRLFWIIESVFRFGMGYYPIVRTSVFEGRACLVSIRHGLDVTYGTMFGPVESVSVWFLGNLYQNIDLIDLTRLTFPDRPAKKGACGKHFGLRVSAAAILRY